MVVFECLSSSHKSPSRKLDLDMSGGSRVRRPGSEDPHRRERNLHCTLLYFRYNVKLCIQQIFCFKRSINSSRLKIKSSLSGILAAFVLSYDINPHKALDIGQIRRPPLPPSKRWSSVLQYNTEPRPASYKRLPPNSSML